MRRSILIAAVALLFVVASCGPHSYWQAASRYDIEVNPNTARRVPHDRKVFITQQTLAPALFEELGMVDVTKVWYGSDSSVLESMADMARQMGADAVIEALVWHQPLGWSWASPQGKGRAIAVRPGAAVDFSQLPGEYR